MRTGVACQPAFCACYSLDFASDTVGVAFFRFLDPLPFGRGGLLIDFVSDMGLGMAPRSGVGAFWDDLGVVICAPVCCDIARFI